MPHMPTPPFNPHPLISTNQKKRKEKKKKKYLGRLDDLGDDVRAERVLGDNDDGHAGRCGRRRGLVLLPDQLLPVPVIRPQVAHQHVAERIVEEAMPLLVQRQHDELEEAHLDLGYARGHAVAERRHGQIELALVVALAEELLADLLRPLARYVPGPAGIRDVRALEGYLEDEVPVLRLLHVELAVVEVALLLGP